MAIPLSGDITFLFTDIEGSTRLAQQFPDNLPFSLEIHNSIMRSSIESSNGFVFEVIGDAFCASFENTSDAVNACHRAQVRLNSQKWNKTVIKVRMGIHRGKAEWNGKRYLGYITLARTQRVTSAAYGGQVLISEDAYNNLTHENNPGLSYRDLGERHLKDLIQPIKIYQLISKEIPSDFPPLKTLDARPNNLPVQLTSFIGRKMEIENVKELILNTHLLTLTGPGGAGKSRLALQVGAEIVDEFVNGVWFIELAHLTDPALLAQEILKELGLKEETKKTPEETLNSFLRDKEILIILDNCEHLIEACAVLTEKLLKTCSKLKVIATSREAMKCSGEQTHGILSLDVPDPKEELSPEQLAKYESVRLFIERALTVNPKFRVNVENASALAGICFQLDGIPLAIELAAARIKVLTVEKIFERLSNRFSLLTEGKRTALPRQQTLKALIDWSYDLLTEPEKILWSRLSVFNDGWTLEFAEEVCPDDKISRDDVFDILNLLVEKSILIFDGENERYRILETLKKYGAEKLKQSNETNVLYSKHLNYCIMLTEKAEARLTGTDAQFWLDKLEAEHGNLQSAIEWSLKNGEPKGMHLAAGLGIFWDIRGYFSVGRQLLENMLINMKGLDDKVRAKAMSRIGNFAKNQGDYSKAFEFFKGGLELYRSLNDKEGIAGTIHDMGVVTYEQGNYEEARRLFEEHLEFNRKTGDQESIAQSLNNLGNIMYDQGDYKQARKFHEESLAIRKLTGNKRGIANSLNNLGNVAYNQNELKEAQELHEKSLAIKRELGDKKGITTSLHNFGILAGSRGDYKEAQRFFEESLELVREIGDKLGMAETLYDLGSVEFKQGEYNKALKLYEESLKLRLEVGNKLGVVYCIMGLTVIFINRNQFIWAARLLGYIDASLESMSAVLEIDELLQYEQVFNELQKKLGAKEFKKLTEEGKKLTPDEALDLALNQSTL